MRSRRLPSRRTLAALFWIVALPLIAGLAVRLLVVAAATETGLETLRWQWRDATVGWFLGAYEPIAAREPVDQAKFWLRETDRILRENPGNAQLTMGAALLLSAPGYDFTIRHPSPIPDWFDRYTLWDFDESAILRAEGAFEALCRQRCLDLAAEATRLEPENVEWWRLRALLLFPHSLYSYVYAPRCGDWLTVLDECARHDPENALYDYLVTSYYWQTIDALVDTNTAELQDTSGLVRFAIGETKRFFAVGEAGLTAVADLTSRVAMPPAVRNRISAGHLVRVNVQRRTYQIEAFLTDWAYLHQRYNRDGKAWSVYQQILHLADQVEASGPGGRCDLYTGQFRIDTLHAMQEFLDEHPSISSPAERKQIATQRSATLARQYAVMAASTLLPSLRNVAISPPHATIRDFAGLSFVGFAPALVVLLLVIGLLATGAAGRWADLDQHTVGWLWQTTTLAAACAATFVVFGLCPAEAIAPKIQAWVLTIGLLLSSFALAASVGWFWLRHRPFQFSISALMALTLVVGVISSTLTALRANWHQFATFPFQLSIPPRNLEMIEITTWRNSSVNTLEPPDWLGPWAMRQWMMYHAQYATLALWAALLLLVLRFKRRANAAAATSFLARLKRRTGTAGRLFAQPALRMAALLLIAYLVLAPAVVDLSATTCQASLAFARNPQAYWAKLDERVQQRLAEEEAAAKEPEPSPSTVPSEASEE